jgi:hypothetical protein
MANIKVIAEHSVDLDLLSCGVCIDAGCLGFQFSKAMQDKGLEVWGYDIQPLIAPEGIHFQQCAIMVDDGVYYYKDTKDPQAKHISNNGIKVPGIELNWVMREHQRDGKSIDVLKMDIEGSEYKILSNPNFAPIPKQLSIEFHMHAHKQLHDEYFDKCMENLLKYYEPVQHELTQAHGAGKNYWDSLFLRRDLIK